MICWSEIKKKMFNTRRFKWVDIIFCIVYNIYITYTYIVLCPLYLYTDRNNNVVFIVYVRFDIIYYDCHTRGLGVPKNSSVQRVSRPFYIDCRALCPFHILRTKHQFNTFPIELFYDGAAAADVLTDDLFGK